ncbi:MAG: enoyl-CoA hydratase/isomerase family protein [Chloroflexi bacterium]|nr:enoyl-CoA hydratase/isomerase family protein [Chloroflexota bacterium]MCL5076178.1 enoyl-CoA hydratase/isomerase family protein [Chloroflexota bacterium]
MQYQTVIYERKENGIAKIILNRPQALNALSRQLMDELASALDEVERDDTVRAVIITGAGRSFSSGFDLKEEADEGTLPPEVWLERFQKGFAVFYKIWQIGKPFIAAVNGYNLAGSLELSLLCDITIAAEDAKFGAPEIRHASGPGPCFMPWVVGMKRAKAMLLTGDTIDAQEALRIGLVNKVVPVDRLQEEAESLAANLALISPVAMRLNKMAINQTYEIMGLNSAIAFNLVMSTLVTATEESRESERQRQSMDLKSFFKQRDAPFQKR